MSRSKELRLKDEVGVEYIYKFVSETTGSINE